MTVTNNMKYQSYACIALVASVNSQGSPQNNGIYTGRILKRSTIKEFPIPNRVLRRMNDW